MISMHAQPELSVATQIRIVLNGNDEAFCDLVKPHRRGLYLKALSIVRNAADAEEVAQNAILKAFHKLSQFRHDSQFRTWLTSITINEALLWLRSSRKYRHESLDCLVNQDGENRQLRVEIVDPRENPFQVLERKQTRSAILKALTGLPSVYSQVLILRDLHMFSISETARTLGISETNVKTRLRRGRLKMQQALAHLRASHRSGQNNGSSGVAGLLRNSSSGYSPSG